MTDLLDTPEGREAVEAMLSAFIAEHYDGEEDSESETVLRDGYRGGIEAALSAALPALERGFRKQMADEIEREWGRRDADNESLFMSPGVVAAFLRRGL